MNVPLSLLLAAEIFSVFSCIDAFPRRWWGSSSKHKYWNRHSSERDHCSVGQCVQSWKCPNRDASSHSSDHCAYSNNGPMVCCVLNNNDDNLHPGNKLDVGFSEMFTTSAYPKVTAERNHRTNVQKNSVSTAPPSKNSTNNTWKRTTDNTFRKIRTTIPGYKPRTSDIRVVFPTESAWIWKKTSYPADTTNAFKKTSDNRITKSWTRRSTTPSVVTSSYFTNNAKRTAPDSTFTTKKRNQTASSKTTKSLVTRSTTTMVPQAYTTKHSKRHVSNPEFITKAWRGTTDYKSTKLWTTRSIATEGYTMGTTRRAVLKPTSFPISGKSTETTTRVMFTSTKSGNERRQDWGKSTPTSTRAQSSRSSTRGYRITTPLPNVNTYLCGIREEGSRTNRGRRNYDDRYHAAGDVSSSATSFRGWQPYQRIVGGEEVEPFSWPWVAALYKVTSPGGNRFLSAGSLINENFVLTAAHVFTPDDLRSASYFVMLGTHNAQDAVAQYLVSSILRHPQYENRYYYHDIALLKLERPVTFNHYVMPVCLPSPDAPLFRDRDLQGKNVTVMGWGDEAFGGKSSRVLREATFPVVSRTSCNTSYLRVASNRFPRGITDDMLCAGDPNGGKDACQGDSGGPLTSIELGRYTQVGIVSFGYQCGDKEFPGVYTKVAPYLGWIAENTLRNRDYENGDYDYY